MAIDKGLWSLKQFKLAYISEDTLGTAGASTGGSETLQCVNIEDFPSISNGIYVNTDLRHGDGRVHKKADLHTSQYLQTKEMSFTGIVDQTVLPVFLENVIGLAVGTSPASYDVPYDYTPPECAHGEDDTGNNTGALTFVIYSPEANNSQIWPGCVVKSLRIYADTSDDAGRLKMDVTIQTRYNIDFDADGLSWTLTANKTTYRSIHDMATTIKINAADVVMNRFELTLENNLKFYGYGANGIPVSIIRGVPQIDVSGVFGVKIDDNVNAFIENGLNAADIEVEISNHATWASATFGMKADYGRFVESFQPEEVEGGAFFNLPIKFFAHDSGDVIQIVP